MAGPGEVVDDRLTDHPVVLLDRAVARVGEAYGQRQAARLNAQLRS